MKTTKEPQRAWLYARVPGNYVESKNTLNVLMLQAQRDGAEVVGWGYDIHHGWLRRPAYRRMMREAKAGHHMGTVIDEICARKGWERPWLVSESSERHCVSNAVASTSK